MRACLRLLLDALQHPESTASIGLREWDDLLRLARRTNLLSRLAESIDQAGTLTVLPGPVRPHLVSALTLSHHQRQAVKWEARHIGNALRSLDVPVILLKGAASSMAGLQAAHGRLFGDVDILVPFEDMGRVEAELMMHGWSSRLTDPYDARYYREWMHELPPMVNIKRGTIVDVHHNILPRTARNHPSADKLLAAARPLEGEAPFHVLDPCDMVIHCATHLFHEGELQNGLRDLFDLDALLKEFSARDENFWRLLPARAREIDLEWPVRLAFRYLEYFIGTRIPVEATQALGSGAGSAWFHDCLYKPGFLPDHPLCHDMGASFARGLLYLRGHYLRMPLGLLALHLGRKAVMRLVKNTSRSV